MTEPGRLLQVVVAKPLENPVVRTVEDKLETWQELVGGYIECVNFATSKTQDGRRLLAIINEEGKLQGLAPNMAHGKDILVGPVVLVAGTVNGEFSSLTDDEAEEARQMAARKQTRLVFAALNAWLQDKRDK